MMTSFFHLSVLSFSGFSSLFSFGLSFGHVLLDLGAFACEHIYQAFSDVLEEQRESLLDVICLLLDE